MDRTARAEELLREIGGRARLVVYVASAPGSGKTRRLLEDARRLAADGKRVAIGWIETKGRPDLERMAAGLPRIPPRRVTLGDGVFEDFDYEAALREKPDVVVLDELAHDNLGDSTNAKRWQDALALKKQGIGVIGAFNIQHLENVAPTVESLIGYPVREIIPLSFLQAADEVVALDVSPRLLQSRVRAGKIVNEPDVDRALNGIFKEQTLYMLRELLLRTVDSLTLPVVRDGRTSMAAAFVYPNVDQVAYLKRTAAIAQALDLGLEVVAVAGRGSHVARAHQPRPGRRNAPRNIRSGEFARRCVARVARSASPWTNCGKARQPAASVRPLHRRRGPNVSRRESGALAVLANRRGPSARRIRKAHRLHRLQPPGRERPMRCSIARTSFARTASTWWSASSKRMGERKRRRCSTVWRSSRRRS